MIPHVLGPGGGAEEVGAAPGLGQAFGGEEIAPQEGLDVLFSLFVRAVLNDGVTDQFGADAENAGELVAERPDLLHEHAGRHPVHLPAAPFLRVAAAHEIAPSRLAKEFLGELDGVRVHVEDHLPGDPLHEVAGLVPDLQLFPGEHVVKHVRLLPVCYGVSVSALM